MAGLDVKAYLIASLKQQHGRYVKDLNAIPVEAHGKSFAGCAKSALYMTAECAWVNGWIAELLEGGPAERMAEDAEEAFYASVDTTEKALKLLDESVVRLRHHVIINASFTAFAFVLGWIV